MEKKTLWNDNSYLLNLRTNKITPFTLPKGSKYFLTDDLLFLRSDYGKGLQGGEYILDRTMGVRYPIRDLDTNVNGEINVDILLEGLREAKYVFLVGSDDIVAIAPDYKDFPEHNFIANAFDIPGEEYDREEKFLQEQAIPYVQIPFLPHRDEALSPDGNFIARPDGIYLVKANQKIVDGFSATGQYRPYSGRYFSVIGWIYDGSGAIYSKFVNICMIEINFFEGPGCFMEIPQPVLKLKVPEEYLSPVSP